MPAPTTIMEPIERFGRALVAALAVCAPTRFGRPSQVADKLAARQADALAGADRGRSA